MRNLGRIILKEAWARKANFCWSVLAVAAAVALCTMLALTEEANRRETKRVMRDMGFNLRVIPADTEMTQFYLADFSDSTMPADSLDKLAEVDNLSYNHLIGVLQGKMTVDGVEALLMGISPEQAPPGRKKPPMVRAVEIGKLQVGAEIARRLKLSKGDEITLAQRTFVVERCMPEMGSIDDLRIIGSLEDVQELLGLPDRINEIKAIDCLCLKPADNPRKILQAEIEKTLPNTRVVMLSNIAEARARARQVSDRNAQLVIAAVVLAATAWVAALAVINVRGRAGEIGLMRALGYGSTAIAALVLGRALLIGAIAAVLGVFVGTWAALTYGPQIFETTAKALRPNWQLAWYALLATPLFAAAASLAPAALAVAQDPADVLRGQRAA